MSVHSNARGFTLIELLIVVAIIAILAAIAVPNFLEAQVRSKVSRVKSDMRTLAVALESYSVDSGKFPLCKWSYSSLGLAIPPPMNANTDLWNYYALCRLTSPVAYTTSIPSDPFASLSVVEYNAGGGTVSRWKTYDYYSYSPGLWGDADAWQAVDARKVSLFWTLNSPGPSRNPKDPTGPDYWEIVPQRIICGYAGQDLWVYDSTNGTTSFGLIIRTNKGEYTGQDFKKN